MKELSQGEKVVLDLVATFEHPVNEDHLDWVTSYSDREAEFSALGPIPRRTALIYTLADLASNKLIDLNLNGLRITKKARALLNRRTD